MLSRNALNKAKNVEIQKAHQKEEERLRFTRIENFELKNCRLIKP